MSMVVRIKRLFKYRQRRLNRSLRGNGMTEKVTNIAVVGGFIIAVGLLVSADVVLRNRIDLLEGEKQELLRGIEDLKRENGFLLRRTADLEQVRDRFFECLLARVVDGRLESQEVRSPYLLADRVFGTRLQVTWPPDSSVVLTECFVEGVTPDPGTAVWIVLHPEGSATYEIQPETWMDDESGQWRGKVSLERWHTETRSFEIGAVAKPQMTLNGGMILSDWPVAKSTSKVVLVRRRRDSTSQ